MSEATYAEALQIIDRLEDDERRRLLAELIARLEQSSKRKRSVLEFKGAGKHNPVGGDPQEFINQERDSWAG